MTASTGPRADGAVRVAVIGVGRIGLPVCQRLIRAGHAVTAVDRSAERVAAAAGAGAATGPTAAQASAGADVVLTILPGSPELRALMLPGDSEEDDDDDGDGLISAIPPGVVWVDLTSAAPALGRELAAAATRRGVPYLDAAVGGGVEAAREGTLTLYVGGEDGVLATCRPLLAALAGDRIRHLGRSGAGYLAKLLVNLLWFGQALATAEALLLGQAGGLDPGRLRDVLLAGPAASQFTSAYLPALFEGDYLTTFGLDRCVEELRSLPPEARESGTPFELSALVADLHARALARFGPVDGELMGVAYLEALAGRAIRPSLHNG